MSVLIKGVDMPKDKAVAVVVHPDGTAHTAKMTAGVCTEYLSDCTAVHVPAHGRLIDADKLREEMLLFIEKNMLARDDARELLVIVDEAPTVIEAEE